MAARLEGKVAIVGGAGSSGPGWGNGKASAVLFAREGARVLCVDINEAAAAETVGLIEGEGGTASACHADLTTAAGAEAMAAACVDRYGRIDVLMNNVGASAPGGPAEMTEAVWDRQFDLNLRTAFLSCKYVMPVMARQKSGAVVNVASIAGIRYLGRDLVGYAASKAALIQMSRAVAMQYVRDGIRSNAILPGLMATPMVVERCRRQYGEDGFEAAMQTRHEMCPSGRMGDAWDVAHAALFLASDEARYVTATELVVDGGLTQQCVEGMKVS